MTYFVGVSIAFFLALILSIKKNKKRADNILAIWLSFTGLHLLLYFLLFTKKYLEFPYLLGLEIPMPLLHGPFLYLYTTALTKQSVRNKINMLHFIPFAIAMISLFPFFTYSTIQKIKVYMEEGKGFETLLNFIFIATVLSGIFYTALSLQRLIKYRQSIPDQFSFTENINLKWLLYLIVGSGIIWFLVIFSEDEYVFNSIVVYVLFIGYFGINQVGIFTNQLPEMHAKPLAFPPLQLQEILTIDIPFEFEIEKQPEKIKYEKSSLSEENLEIIYKDLCHLMHNERMFKNPELKLTDVAEKLQVHPNTLSQVINSMEKKNFYDYINLQRVEEFKVSLTLTENHKLIMLVLALESGFNSKTSFNRNFKKATNLSPSEYLKQVQVNLQ